MPPLTRAATALLWLALALPARGQPASWTLRYLPASVDYELRSTDTVRVESGGRTAEKVNTVARLVTRRITPVAGSSAGTLEVWQADGPLEVSLGRGRVQLDPARPPAVFRVLATGAAQGRPPLDLVFPDQPVTAGSHWESQAPPSRASPIPMTTRYRVERSDVVAGRTCVIVVAEVTGEGKAGERGAQVTHRGRTRLAFDPRAGLLVRAVSDATTTIEEPPDAKGHPRRKTTQIRSRLLLR